MRIDTNLAESVIIAVAKQLGFHVSFDRDPTRDEWRLSRGHGDTFEEIIGTRASISAFLEGYSNMSIRAFKILKEIEAANRCLLETQIDKLKADA